MRLGRTAIHRPVSLPGFPVSEPERTAERLILQQLRDLRAREVRDLGCGVGGSMAWLQARHPARYAGLTISGEQARIAERRYGESGVQVLHGNYNRAEDLLALGGPADCVYFIESLVHSESPGTAIRAAASLLGPGGRLLVLDDFVAGHNGPRTGPGERLMLERFRDGWRVPGLQSLEQTRAEAEAAGLCLRRCLDLSGFARPRLRVDLLAPLLRPRWVSAGMARPALANIIGGLALRRTQELGVTRYCFVVFDRTSVRPRAAGDRGHSIAQTGGSHP